MCSLEVLDQTRNFTSCSDWDVFYSQYKSSYEDIAETLRKKPILRINKSKPTLYVQQGEYAILSNTDPIFNGIGTDRSTTCHIVIMQTKDKSLTALGHFDGSCTEQGINDMAKELIQASNHENEIDLHIVGGFEDDRGLSLKLTSEIIIAFCTHGKRNSNAKVKFKLCTYCCTDLNTIFKPSIDHIEEAFPVMLGVTIDVVSGEINNAVFDDDAMGPACQLRGARIYSDHHNMSNIYKQSDNLMQITAFKYTPIKNALLWAQQPNEIIRQYMSTSPNAEPENFEKHTRETLIFLHNNPNSELVFNGRTCIYYKPRKMDSEIIWEEVD